MNNDTLSQTLDELFAPESYQGHLWADQYKIAGLNLIDEINLLDPDLVIDAGCAHNRFKGHIKNLIGFDRTQFPFADLCMSIESAPFKEECADVVLALGSIHFGDHALIEQQINKVVSWTKPGGFIVMRANSKLHFEDKFSDIRFCWSDRDFEYFTQKHNLLVHRGPVIEQRYYNSNDDVLRAEKMVWWWQKPGQRKKYKIDPVTCQLTERSQLEIKTDV